MYLPQFGGVNQADQEPVAVLALAGVQQFIDKTLAPAAFVNQ
jgi:hypothetical protein